MRIRSLLLISLVAGCGDSGPTEPSNKTHDVFTIESTFSDVFLQIQPGDTVRWHFTVATDGFGHNVIFNPRPPGTPANIDEEKRSGTESRVFTTRGTFHYVCTLHGSMTADVIVE
jgi:plastocyanin